MITIQQLYKKKHCLLVQMLEKTQLLAGLDDSEQWDEFNALVAERQKYIADIDFIDQEIKKIKEAPAEGTELDPPDADKAREKCLRVVSEIRELDFKQLGRLNQQLAILQQQLSKIRAGRKALGAYTGNHGPEGMHVDKMK